MKTRVVFPEKLVSLSYLSICIFLAYSVQLQWNNLVRSSPKWKLSCFGSNSCKLSWRYVSYVYDPIIINMDTQPNAYVTIFKIKKLEAEEVSYYVREIPNKPPPPYTPPGKLSASLDSPSLITAVIPSNVEELTSFTEKATALIYNAKLAGEDITSLEAPSEIYELIEDKSEKRDRRIYNTFLFDLCKETIVEIYQAEYEKPSPSWTKPNVERKEQS